MPSALLTFRKDGEVAAKAKHRAGTLEQAFGNVLVGWRKKRDLSQMDLAVASGYSLRYIGDIERGTKSATMRTMNDLATLLDVRLGTLIVEAENLLEKDLKERKRNAKAKR